MAARRRTLSLLVLFLLVSSAVPARGQDLDFTAVPKITIGLTNQGAVCSTGVLGLSPGAMTGGSKTGVVVGGSEVPCSGGPAVPFLGGDITLLGNRSVVGDIDGNPLFGHLLPGGHGVVAVTTLFNSSIGTGFGLTAFVEPGGATFTQSHLTGAWRIKSLSGTASPEGGLVETAFGSIVFAANGSVVGGSLFYNGDIFVPFVGGNVSVSPTGQLVGFVQSFDGEVFEELGVNGFMAPDKNFIGGVGVRVGPFGDAHAMFFLQREPAATVDFDAPQLQGVWNVFSLQGVVEDATAGIWFRGWVEFDEIGQIVDSHLVDANGVVFPPVSDGAFSLDSRGFISGSATFQTGSFLRADATMFADKKQIIGVNRFDPNDDVNPTTRGLFAMFKPGTLGPPPAPSQVRFSALNYGATEGAPATITVNRTGATSTIVMVDYEVLGLDDVVLASGQLTFTAGQGARTFVFTPAQNGAADGDRVLQLRLLNPTNGATLGSPAMANLNVADDESLVEFTTDHYFAMESARTATITLKRTGGLRTPTSVRVSALPGTAVSGQDFTPFLNQEVVFAANTTTKTFAVPLFDDKLLDGNRTVMLTLGGLVLVDGVAQPALAPPPGPPVIGPRGSATLTLQDNDKPGQLKLGSSSYTGTEGAIVNVIVQRLAQGGAPLGGNVSVDYLVSSNGSAVAGLDYAVDMGLSGTLIFTGSETSKTVPIRLLQDSLAEGKEFFVFRLSNPTNDASLITPSQATVNINDDDKGGVVTLGASKLTVTEGTGNLSVTVRRSGGTASNVSVLFSTGGGTAIPGTDYTGVTTTIVFGLNETTKTVIVPILQDLEGDGDKTFTISLSLDQGGATIGAPATAQVIILDDESAIQFGRAEFVAKEGTLGLIEITRTGALVSPATVAVNLSSLSAFPGVDFTGPLVRTVTFPARVARQTFPIPTINNTIVDGNRSLMLSLEVLSGGAQLGTQGTAIFTIMNDDQAGQFRLGQAAYSAREGATLMVDIVRQPTAGVSGPLGGNVSVHFATVAGNASAGSDFTHASGTAVFGPNQTRFTVPVPILQDPVVDPGEVLHFSLTGPGSGATLAAPSSASILIGDDDVGGTVFLSAKAYAVREDVAGGNISIVVRRAGGAAADVSVTFLTMPGTAIDGGGGGAPGPRRFEVPFEADYGPVFTRLTFAANEMSKTVVIPIFNDESPEGDEMFFVALTDPSQGLKLGSPATAPVTIVDDEQVIQFSGRFVNNQPEVIRTGSLQGNVSVDYVATSGTAILGEDFVLPPGTLVFPPGVRSRTINVRALADDIVEGAENFTLTLFDAAPPAQLGPNFSQLVTLDDADFGGTVGFTNTSPTATLGQVAPITLRRVGGAGTIMTVGWATVGGTANSETDFSPSSGMVTFQRNESAQTFFVNIGSSPSAAGKTIVFNFTLPLPNARFAPGANVSTLTIVGEPSVIQFSQTTYSVNEDQGVATITVKRTGNLSQPATVHYATSDGTASTSSEDYSAATGTLSFPASEGSYQHQSFTVNVSDDGEAEGTETVNLTLTNATGDAVLGERSTAVLEINDPLEAGYSFTVLYSGGSSVGLPSLNDFGQFAFSIDTSEQTVFSGNIETPFDLRTVTALPDSGVLSLRGTRFPVDGGERVAYRANFAFDHGIVLDSNSSAPTMFFATGEGILDVGQPSLSLNGTLAFKSVEECDGSCDTVRLSVDGLPPSYAVATGDTTDAGFVHEIGAFPAVNDGGLVAFTATTFSGYKGVFTVIGGAVTTLASTNGSDFTDFGDKISVNTGGQVAFVGTLPDGNTSVNVAMPGEVTMRAVTSPGGFTSFGDGTDATALINSNGDVVFLAFFEGGHGIFVGNNGVHDKVVATGDTIDGRVVLALQLGGFNSAGKITFIATLQASDESIETAAILATPPQSPCQDCVQAGLRR